MENEEKLNQRLSAFGRDRMERLCQMLRGGADIHAACASVSLSWNNFRKWRMFARRDENEGKDDSPYIAFWREVEKARGERIAFLAMQINRVADAAVQSNNPEWAVQALKRLDEDNYNFRGREEKDEDAIDMPALKIVIVSE